MSIESFPGMGGVPEQPEQNNQNLEENKEVLSPDLERKKNFTEAWATAAIEAGYELIESDEKHALLEKDGQRMEFRPTMFFDKTDTMAGFVNFNYPDIPLLKPSNISFAYPGELTPETMKKTLQEIVKKNDKRYDQDAYLYPTLKVFNQAWAAMAEEHGFKITNETSGRLVIENETQRITMQHIHKKEMPEGEKELASVQVFDKSEGKTTTTAFEWDTTTINEMINPYFQAL